MYDNILSKFFPSSFDTGCLGTPAWDLTMYVCFTVRILYRRDETEWINITFVSITRKRGARAGTKSWFECDNRIWRGHIDSFLTHGDGKDGFHFHSLVTTQICMCCCSCSCFCSSSFTSSLSLAFTIRTLRPLLLSLRAQAGRVGVGILLEIRGKKPLLSSPVCLENVAANVPSAALFALTPGGSPFPSIVLRGGRGCGRRGHRGDRRGGGQV